MKFTERSWKAFKLRYQKAVTAKEDQFSYEGMDFLTEYARRLIDYYDPQSKTK